jgi:hypothetical protein
MKLRILLMSVLLVGCYRTQKPDVSKDDTQRLMEQLVSAPEPKSLSSHEKLELLRTEAKKLGMGWRIYCISWAKPDEKGFQAEAWRKNESSADDAPYVHDRWMIDEYTQADAAYALYLSIQGYPTHPKHEPSAAKKEKEYRRLCPPEMNDHNTVEPCEKCKVVEVTPE